MPKTVADPDVPKNVPKAAEEPEISKTVPKSVTGSKVQVRKQEEDSNVPPTGPLLPSLTKVGFRIVHVFKGLIELTFLDTY